ncbi:MAG: S8 family serine peptidase [Cyclobacteriaceae bacterium]
MRKFYQKAIALLLLLVALGANLSAQQLPNQLLPGADTGKQLRDPQQFPQYHEDRLFVKVSKSGANARSADPVVVLKNKEGVRKVTKAFPNIASAEIDRIYQLEVDPEKADELTNELQSSGLLDYAERVPIYYTFETPNDPFFADQYAMQIIKSAEAFSAFTGNISEGNEVVVAVVDDAVLLNHEDLRDRIYFNPGESGIDAEGNDKRFNGIDDDGNGYIDDWRGWDAADEDNDPNPPLTPTPEQGNQAAFSNFFHGTFCAGIVGAATNNGLGMATIANNSVKIMAVKATENETENVRSLQATFDGVLYAIEAGADVVNMSYGGGGFSQTYQDLINFGASRGIVFVAAAGNDGSDVIQYPAGYDNVIAVANSGRGDILSGSSSFGSWVDVTAPGSSVLSTTTENVNGTVVSNGYQLSSGTSFSSPLVASLVGLLKKQSPGLTAPQLEEILKNTADDISLVNPGFENQLGGGRINAYAAIVEAGGQAVKPSALFSILPLQDELVAGGKVQFYNQSTSTKAATYQWEFPGGEPSVSSQKNPQITYNQAGVYDVTLTVTDAGGSHTFTIEDAVKVDELLEADLLSFPFDEAIGATIISGHSGNNIPAFANKYFFKPGRVISGARFSFFNASGGSESSNLRVVVWEADAFGRPGKEIYRQAYLLSEIEGNALSAEAAYHDFVFDQPVEVPEDGVFFIGMEIDYGRGDAVTLHHYRSDGLRTSLFFNNQWRTYNSAGGGIFDFTMLMFPAVADPDLVPSADFTISNEQLCLNQEVAFSVEEAAANIDYTWFTGAENTEPGSGEVFATLYTETGEFSPRLLATRTLEVEKEGARFTVSVRSNTSQLLRVADCDKDVEVAFSSDKIALPLGEQVQFFNETDNATQYTWFFEGGTPSRSDETNPVVTYAKPGTYNVELRAKNPRSGDEKAFYSNYITIFAPGQDCFEQGKPFAQPFSLFNFNAGGSVSGHNSLNIATYARRFELEPASALTSILLSFRELQLQSGANSSIKLQFWSVNDAAPAPAEIIFEESITVAELIANTDISGGQPEYTYKLRQPFTVPANGQIFVGIELTYDGLNTVSLNLGAIGSSSGLNSGLIFNGNWLTYGGLNISADLAIAVSGVKEAGNAPVAAFDVLTETPVAGFPIRLNGLKSDNALVYDWKTSGGTLSSTIEPQTTVVFDKPGTYEVSLSVSGNCDSKLSRITQTIIVEAPPVLSLGACELDIADFEGAAEIIAIQEVTYAEFARKKGSYVIGVATGIRSDGKAGAWEIHSDCSVQPLRRSGLANRTTLLPDVKGVERDRGWSYVPTSISEDGREIFATAFNEKGFTHKRGWTVEPGTSIEVKFTLGAPFYGRIRGAQGSILCDNLVVETFASNFFVIRCEEVEEPVFTIGDCNFATESFEGAAEIIAVQEVSYADFTRKKGSYVIGIATGIRTDGKAGAWEIHSDCSVQPLRRSGRKDNTTLLPDVRGVERANGWKYIPYAISDNGGEILATAVNENGYTHQRGWQVEAGTSLDIKFSLGSPFYGRIRGAEGSILCNDLKVETSAGNYFVIRCDDSQSGAAARLQQVNKQGSADELEQNLNNSAAFSIHAFPNPIQDKLQLMISVPADENLSIAVYDVLGRLIMEKEELLRKGDNALYLQVDKWNTDAKQFFLRLQAPSIGLKTIPLLKQ